MAQHPAPWTLIERWTLRSTAVENEFGLTSRERLEMELVIRRGSDEDDPHLEAALRWKDRELGERLVRLTEDEPLARIPPGSVELGNGETWYFGLKAAARLREAA